MIVYLVEWPGMSGAFAASELGEVLAWTVMSDQERVLVDRVRRHYPNTAWTFVNLLGQNELQHAGFVALLVTSQIEDGDLYRQYNCYRGDSFQSSVAF